ncbi:CDP-diacylglycerol--glycerol-3-phosphate 3-phosphatidyltransferase [Candidatus Saccharibacteria bacterium]|nr:CDP-diacylglycerol--glycerol-3-phosphate 3-phosphatidyltransferase [Candidatus Saccharibacteria bacterium]
MTKTQPNSLNLPTILTFVRIALVIPFMICFFINTLPAQIITIVCFIMASLTDYIDGYLARKNHQVTIMGAFLDPLADKILINLTFLALVYVRLVPLWVFAIILIRDFAIDGIRMISAQKGISLPAVKSGKIKTFFQMCTIILILLNIIFQNPVFATMNNTLLYIVVFLTIFSGVEIFAKGWKQLSK